MLTRLRKQWRKVRPAAHQRDDRIVRTERPGAPPGTLTVESSAPAPSLTLTWYGAGEYAQREVEQLSDVADMLRQHAVTWLNVDGLGDVDTIAHIGHCFGLHNLTVEDLVHVDQRPKVELFPQYLFVVTRMFVAGGARLASEQLSIVVGKRFVLTFQERVGDCLGPVRRRLQQDIGNLRERGPDYLAYAIIDTITDRYFPVLVKQGERLDLLEDEIIGRPRADIFGRIHDARRELALLRRVVLPHREMVAILCRRDTPLLSADTRLHLRDIADHTEQLREQVESLREVAGGLFDMQVSLAGHRMNEVMKVLTVVGAVFIPLTFITGLYGMNFDHHVSRYNMPELHHPYGYPLVLAGMLLLALVLLLFFARRGWIGRGGSG